MTLETHLRTSLCELIVDDLEPSAPYKVRVKRNYPTALWCWLPPHSIYVGDRILNRARDNLAEADVSYYVGSYLHHEMGHAWFTERDFSKLSAMLEQVGCSMQLLNLFEDARIEHLWRKQSKRPFRWMDCEPYDEDANATPPGLFFSLIQSEGNVSQALGNRLANPRDARVYEFYQSAIAAPSTLALKPLLAQWVSCFDGHPPLQGRNADRVMGEFAQAAHLQLQADSRLAFDEDSDPLECEASEKNTSVLLPDKRKSMTTILEHINSGLLLAEPIIDPTESLDAHVSLLKKILVRPARRTFTDIPSKRLSAWRNAANRPCFGHTHSPVPRPKKVSLVIDCSGSMNGKHIEAARIFTRMLNSLSRSCLISGSLILSAVVNSTAMAELFAWPVQDEVIDRIYAFGTAEGLQSAITQHAVAIRSSEMVYVFTDGNITDEPLNLAELYRLGIDVCGLYVGDMDDAIEDLKRHFARSIVRESVGALVDAIVAGA